MHHEWHTSSHCCCAGYLIQVFRMTRPFQSLQALSDALPAYDQTIYRTKLTFIGSRTVFTTDVYRSSMIEENAHELKTSGWLERKLTFGNLGFVEKLKKRAATTKSCLWISDTLAADLNVPVTTKVPHPKFPSVQVLFLGENRELFMLTVCDVAKASTDKKSEDIQADLRKYSAEIAKLLTSALYNFCHCDFVILPCALVLAQDWDVQALEKEIEEQRTAIRHFYGGPEIVTTDTYPQLMSALTAAASVSYFPCLLRESESAKVWLLLLDPDWRNLLLRVIEAMHHADCEPSITFTPDTEFKVKVAVLEAATRLSMRDHVIIITTDERIPTSIRRLMAEVEKEDMQEPNLTVMLPTDLSPPVKYIVNVDRSWVFFRCEIFRFLLFGKTGSGKSATGNTILGKQIFKEYFTLSLGTTECEMKSTTQGGMKAEVMDTPGLYDASNSSALRLKNIHTELLKRKKDLDAVLYVVEIHRYTDEDLNVFLRTKAVLGDDLVKHMIVVFTFGDEIGNDSIKDTLSKASWMLHQVLLECEYRHVVFNNEAIEDRLQVDKLITEVKKMKEKHTNVPYECPNFSPGEIACRWNESIEQFTRLMRQNRTKPGG